MSRAPATRPARPARPGFRTARCTTGAASVRTRWPGRRGPGRRSRYGRSSGPGRNYLRAWRGIPAKGCVNGMMRRCHAPGRDRPRLGYAAQILHSWICHAAQLCRTGRPYQGSNPRPRVSRGRPPALRARTGRRAKRQRLHRHALLPAAGTRGLCAGALQVRHVRRGLEGAATGARRARDRAAARAGRRRVRHAGLAAAPNDPALRADGPAVAAGPAPGQRRARVVSLRNPGAHRAAPAARESASAGRLSVRHRPARVQA